MINDRNRNEKGKKNRKVESLLRGKNAASLQSNRETIYGGNANKTKKAYDVIFYIEIKTIWALFGRHAQARERFTLIWRFRTGIFNFHANRTDIENEKKKKNMYACLC